MKVSVLTLICLLLLPWSSFAQETADSLQTAPPDYESEPVIVTATRQPRPILRVPYAVDLIHQNDIQSAELGLSLEESMRHLPGVVVHNRYNPSQGDRITLRGIGSRAAFGVRGLKLIQDGVPLTMADGQSQLNNLDLSSTGQIEVLRGPSSSLYGNASGGVIILRTQPAAAAPIQAQPRFLTGSNGLRKWQGKVSGQTGRHGYVINMNHLWLDGYRDFSEARSTNINAIGRHTLSERITLTTVFNYYDAPYLLNPSSLDKATADTAATSARLFVQRQGASKKIKQGQGGVTAQYNDMAGNQLEMTLYGLERTLFNPIPGRIIDLDRSGGGVRTVFSRETPLGGTMLRWTAGADLEFLSDTRKEFDNGGIPSSEDGNVHDDKIFRLLTVGTQRLNQDEKVFGVGPFAELELTPHPAWIFTLGGRYDSYHFRVDDHFQTDNVDYSGTRTMDQFSPMAGVTYRPHPFMTVYGNFATSYQTPTTTELSNRPAGEGGFNPDLKPEQQRGFEVGFKRLWPAYHLTWDTAFYIFNINDMLIPFQVNDPNSEEIFFRNVGKTQNKGMELGISWTPVPAWRLSLAYTVMDFEFKDFQVEQQVNNTPTLFQLKGNEVPGVPPQHVFVGLHFRHATGLFAETNLQWIDRYFANDFNGPAPGGTKPVRDFINDAYALVDLRFGIQRGIRGVGVDIFFGVDNVLNKRYNGSIVPNAAADRFFEPAAGRTWFLGAGIPIPHQP